MYRKSDGRTGFSAMRMVTNMFPNFARDDVNDVELTPDQLDGIFAYQMGEPNPMVLGDLAFWHARICENQYTSKQVHRDLRRNNCIAKATGLVDTTAITKHFANQVAHISVHAQRKLITLLFFWEEEQNRWRLMDEEEAEIERQMEAAREAGDEAMVGALEGARRVLEGNRRLKPSERTESGGRVGEAGGGGGEEELPAYSK
ncbi:hypothetical protein BAUCODRAFT_156653 [Baudoinia panamericana UAMH 10762]|uniref:Uncharacterized protein n=1 Tax=Baudoinia panamericana (strain UAMH 10762) TaxID=717646 RepID=M2LQ33_BAUPA|nr:uncharacterized protein BAUCODRAFT_156653 [Baudoinia panamericana UAMH 10762]EMC96497.1 hypothetical protein BAUCODRAFT_156653 [Baudoinia panamericana UAMH 10762]